MHKEIQI